MVAFNWIKPILCIAVVLGFFIAMTKVLDRLVRSGRQTTKLGESRWVYKPIKLK